MGVPHNSKLKTKKEAAQTASCKKDANEGKSHLTIANVGEVIVASFERLQERD